MKYKYSETLPLHLQVWLATDYYKHSDNPNQISATSLLKPVKSLILSKRLDEMIANAIANKDFSLLNGVKKPDLSGFLKSRMGTAMHDSVEKAWKSNYAKALKDLGHKQEFIDRIAINPENPSELPSDAILVFTEKRLNREIDGYIVTGELDFVFNRIIQDLKTTTTYAYKHAGDAQHTMQMSIYHWIFAGNGIDLESEAQINYIFTDWAEWEAKRDPQYPQSNPIGVCIDLNSHSEVEAFIRQKMKDVQDSLNTPEQELIPCTPEELWQAESKWAFYANPQKMDGRASKVFTDYKEAVAHKAAKGDTGVIQERVGQVKRCNFCAGAPLCTQKDTYIAAGLLEYDA